MQVILIHVIVAMCAPSAYSLRSEGMDETFLEVNRTSKTGECDPTDVYNPRKKYECEMKRYTDRYSKCTQCQIIGYEMRRAYGIQIADDPLTPNFRTGPEGETPQQQEERLKKHNEYIEETNVKTVEAFLDMIDNPSTAQRYTEALQNKGCSCCMTELGGSTWVAWHNQETCPELTYGKTERDKWGPWTNAEYPLWCALQYFPKKKTWTKFRLYVEKDTYDLNKEELTKPVGQRLARGKLDPWYFRTFDGDGVDGGYHGCLAGRLQPGP